MKLFNTFGYSLHQLENFQSASSTSRIKGISEKVIRWSDSEKNKYIESLILLKNHLKGHGFDIYTKNTIEKNNLKNEILNYIDSKSGTIAEGFLRVLKKELNGEVKKHVNKQEVSIKQINAPLKISLAGNKQESDEQKLSSANHDVYFKGKIKTEKPQMAIDTLIPEV